MPPETLDAIMADRGSSTSDDRNDAPQITDAERAANPIGASRRERDHAGRFAPKEEKAEAQTDTQQKPEGKDGGDKSTTDQQDGEQRRSGTVPQQALEAERRKRQERDDDLAQLRRQYADLERRLAMPQQAPQPQQPKPEAPPPVWKDPDAWMRHGITGAIDPVQKQMEGLKLHYSQEFAKQQHGADAVGGAINALAELRQSDPREWQALEARVANSMDPVGDVVRWHKQRTAIKEIGDDPSAYKERLRAELMAELQREREQDEGGERRDPQPAPQQRAPNLPSSFAAQRSGAPRGGQGYGGPRALSDIMPRG